jgi:peptidoglycan/LPS O-acetylase OafA/YrhL
VLLSGDASGAFEPALMDMLCMLIVGAAVIRPDNDFAVLARIPGIVHIGVVSYGLYLLHMLSANVVKLVGGSLGLASGVGYFAATLIVALCVASLSHATFERWMLSLRPRLLQPNSHRLAPPRKEPIPA